MSREPPPQTPTRRSRRFQPLATPLLQRRTTKLECYWEGDPIYTRQSSSSLDLLLEEQTQVDEGTLEELRDTETAFYASFVSKIPKAWSYRGKQSNGDGPVTYRCGDTITVETDTLSRVRKPPSVAVITSMWEVRKRGEAVPQEHDPSRMRVRVHWFLRPSELPVHRQKREHYDNEVYYSLDSSDIIDPSVIVSRCSLSSQRTQIATPEEEKWAHTPMKPKRSPKKMRKGSSSTAPEEDANPDESEGDLSTLNSLEPPVDRYFCRCAVSQSRGLYYTFKWEQHHRASLESSMKIPDAQDSANHADWGSGRDWDVDTTEGSKRTRKPGPPPKKRAKVAVADDISEEDVDSGSEAEIEEEEDGTDEDEDVTEDEGIDVDDEDKEGSEVGTPSRSRKRKRSQNAPKTPRKNRAKALAQPTPHSKAALRQRKKLRATNTSPRKQRAGFVIRPPALSFKTDLSRLPKDPWLRAMHVLHVGNRPDALPCRGDEYAKVLQSVGDLLEEGSGGCVYISGVPGTGKTATVHTVVRELKRMAEANEINPFTYVEINGLRIPEPSVAYTLLWESIARNTDPTKDPHLRVSSKESLKALTHHFSGRKIGPSAGHAYVVLMDELDQLVTVKQDVIYNFFNWPTLAGSRLVVIAVANTMDLPERVMTGRVRSRLGMTRINFAPYTTPQLQEIVQARLATAKEGLDEANADCQVMSPDAVKLAAVRISRITGDARRVLDVCRRVVEHVSSTKTTAGPNHVTKILSIMQSSPTAGYLHDCSLHERIMLASLIKCIKREGVEEIKWSDVQYQHLTYIGALTGSEESQRKPSVAELAIVLDTLVASRAVLLEDGAAVARKPSGDRRLLLNIEQIEVERVLSDVGGQMWKNVLST